MRKSRENCARLGLTNVDGFYVELVAIGVLLGFQDVRDTQIEP